MEKLKFNTTIYLKVFSFAKAVEKLHKKLAIKYCLNIYNYLLVRRFLLK
jgi:hypothetical protein